MDQPVADERATFLKDLTGNTWNLELTISGAATFAVSFLPALIDQALQYYLEHLAPTLSGSNVTMPLLAYSYLKVSAWTLMTTFILHLCMRAVWVGAVGLHSVYPHGIRYDQIPHASETFREVAERRLGTLEDFIVRLHRLCNQVFALGFMLAMTITGISMLYLVIFSLKLLIELYLPAAAGEWVAGALQIAFGVVALGGLWLQQRLAKHPEKRHLAIQAAKLQMGLGAAVFPGMSRALNYYSFTFSSNVSRRRYNVATALVTVGMIVCMAFVLINKMIDVRGRTLPGLRDYGSAGTAVYGLNPAAYDNQRGPDVPLPALSIAQDQVEDDFLPVFVKYPHYLDVRITAHCPPVPDVAFFNKHGKAQRFSRDSASIQCFQTFFRLHLNDSLIAGPDWLFTHKAGAVGLAAYLSTAACRPGRNVLRVEIPSEQKPDSLEVYGQVSFWKKPSGPK